MPFAGDDFIFLAVMLPGGPGMGAVVDWGLGFYRPLSQGVLLCGMAGLLPPDPVLFHVFIFALYLAAAGIYFSLVHRLTGSPRLAALAALLWGSRSVHFLAVAWVSAAQEVLMTFFALAALRLAVPDGKPSPTHASSPFASPFRGVAVACFTLAALLSKESAVILPVVIWAVLIAAGISPRRAIRHPHVFASGIVAALWLVMRLTTSALPEHAASSLGSAAGFAQNLVAYPLMFFDVNREVIRHLAEGRGLNPSLILFPWLFAGIAVVVAVGALAVARPRKGWEGQQESSCNGSTVTADQPRRSMLARAALIWGVAAALPPLFHTQAFYGYYMLLAHGGWCLLAALGLRALIRRAGWGSADPVQRRAARALAACAIGAIVIFAAASLRVQMAQPGSLYQRAHRIENGLAWLKSTHPVPPPGSVIHITDLDAGSEADARLWRAIGWGAALPVLWGDGALRVHSAFQPLDGDGESATSIFKMELKPFLN